MYPLLAVLVVASQMFYYEAKVTTFGCNSNEEVSELRRIRTDEKAFQTELVQQIFYGQCIEIPKGKLVEGSVDADHSSMLQVDRQILPPGYLAPLDDFEPKPTDAKE